MDDLFDVAVGTLRVGIVVRDIKAQSHVQVYFPVHMFRLVYPDRKIQLCNRWRRKAEQSQLGVHTGCPDKQ